MSSSALNELGFAEFVAKLISDTFSAILSSQAEQKDKLAELDRLMALSETEFVDLCLTDESLLLQIDEQLQALFPADNEMGHLIVVGADYQPETARKPEKPAIYELTGIQLSKDNQEFERSKLTQAGVDRIYQTLIHPIAMQQRDSLAAIMADGIPKLVVDSGKINAKLTFQTAILEEEDMANGEAAHSESTVDSSSLERGVVSTASHLSISALQPSNRFVGVIDTKKLLNTRLSVVPASNKAPQDAQTSANIYSEVEIHFKTIL
ncbi:MAG: hypothetical protein U9R28_04310 [Pseudomonadota bacterium]|nr:hypothetical protein [Pseudomonadota bacterium]